MLGAESGEAGPLAKARASGRSRNPILAEEANRHGAALGRLRQAARSLAHFTFRHLRARPCPAISSATASEGIPRPCTVVERIDLVARPTRDLHYRRVRQHLTRLCQSSQRDTSQPSQDVGPSCYAVEALAVEKVPVA